MPEPLPARFWANLGSIVLATWVMPQTLAQTSFWSNLQPPSILSHDSNNNVVSGWVLLDGRSLFQIAAMKANFPERLQNIQQNLARISLNYFQDTSTKLQIQISGPKELRVIYGLLRSFGDLSADSVWKPNSSVEAGSDRTRFYQNCVRAQSQLSKDATSKSASWLKMLPSPSQMTNSILACIDSTPLGACSH